MTDSKRKGDEQPEETEGQPDEVVQGTSTGGKWTDDPATGDRRWVPDETEKEKS